MQIVHFTKNTYKEAVKESVKTLKNGGIVAYPTESFYALGVNASNEPAVKKIYTLKKRTRKKAMPIIVGNEEMLKSLVKNIQPQAEKLMKKFWPGPLTLVFESKGYLPEILTGGTGKIAVRIPGKGFALDLVQTADLPITATSANYSGQQPARSSGEVIKYFKENIDLIIEDVQTPGGKPSTILDVTTMSIKVLREGSIRADQLLNFLSKSSDKKNKPQI
jgi:L-threonylcarbamoyladenylate synthase